MFMEIKRMGQLYVEWRTKALEFQPRVNKLKSHSSKKTHQHLSVSRWRVRVDTGEATNHEFPVALWETGVLWWPQGPTAGHLWSCNEVFDASIARGAGCSCGWIVRYRAKNLSAITYIRIHFNQPALPDVRLYNNRRFWPNHVAL